MVMLDIVKRLPQFKLPKLFKKPEIMIDIDESQMVEQRLISEYFRLSIKAQFELVPSLNDQNEHILVKFNREFLLFAKENNIDFLDYENEMDNQKTLDWLQQHENVMVKNIA